MSQTINDIVKFYRKVAEAYMRRTSDDGTSGWLYHDDLRRRIWVNYQHDDCAKQSIEFEGLFGYVKSDLMNRYQTGGRYKPSPYGFEYEL